MKKQFNHSSKIWAAIVMAIHSIFCLATMSKSKNAHSSRRTASVLFPTIFFLGLVQTMVFSQSNYAPTPTMVCGLIQGSNAQKPTNLAANPLAICTDPNSVKYIRVNVHFINRSDGTGNFNPNNDGNGNTSMNGYKRAETIINFANTKLANNMQMWRPSNNSTPVVPIRVRYVLTGVYFHNSDYWITAYWNLSDLNSTYGVNTSSEINYYYTRSMLNGVELGGNGIAELGGGAALSSEYPVYLQYPNYLEFPSRLMRHEIGHNLNLDHTWNTDDGCADTPVAYQSSTGDYIQCDDWTSNTSSPCNNWANVSNNSMDYNVYSNALTPCQIGRVHNHLNGWGNQYVHSCDGCPPVNSFFDLSGCFRVVTNPRKPQPAGQPQLYLNGEGSFNENQYKIEICEVAALNSSNCIGNYYNGGWKSGEIGKIDLKTLYNFGANKFYKVILNVASTSCPGVSSAEKYFQITEGNCYSYAYFNIQTAPNPAVSSMTVRYTMEEEADLEMLLFDSVGNLVKSVPKQKYLVGEQESTITTADLRDGVYFLVLKSKEKVEKKTIYVNH